jgi:hypothetical protein
VSRAGLEGGAQAKFGGGIARQEVWSSEGGEGVIKMPDHFASNQKEKRMQCLRFPFFCNPGRHGGSLNRHVQPQKAHDKLPFDGTQETFGLVLERIPKGLITQAYRNMARHEEGRWYRRVREFCD